MLTVDGIMRGPKMIGTGPTNVRWSKDSAKIYFSWQKPDQTTAATYVVNKDGTGLRELSADEARALDTPQTGRLDRTRTKALAIENGDVVIHDLASGGKRVLMRKIGRAHV